MKSMKLILSIVFVVSLIIVIPGCKKDMNQTSQSSVNLKAEDVKITSMLEAFKAKMNSHLKDGELISTDSVVWYLEGCLNETYARAADSIKTIWEDSAFVEIPNKDRMVLISDINNAYEYFVNEISKHYYSINEEKELVFVNVELKRITDETIVVEMKDYVAKKPGPPNPNYLPNFGPEDNWIWGLLGGKCNNGGYLHEKDAATQLAEKANILGYGPGIYWMKIYTTPEIDAGIEEIQTTSNPYGYFTSLLFYHGSTTQPEYDECLTFDQMNYYLTNLRSIGIMYKPVGKSIMNYEVGSTVTVGKEQGWNHLHFTIIKYGIPVSIGVPREIVPPPHN